MNKKLIDLLKQIIKEEVYAQLGGNSDVMPTGITPSRPPLRRAPRAPSKSLEPMASSSNNSVGSKSPEKTSSGNEVNTKEIQNNILNDILTGSDLIKNFPSIEDPKEMQNAYNSIKKLDLTNKVGALGQFKSDNKLKLEWLLNQK
jgi:hypothetical protein